MGVDVLLPPNPASSSPSTKQGQPLRSMLVTFDTPRHQQQQQQQQQNHHHHHHQTVAPPPAPLAQSPGQRLCSNGNSSNSNGNGGSSNMLGLLKRTTVKSSTGDAFPKRSGLSRILSGNGTRSCDTLPTPTSSGLCSYGGDGSNPLFLDENLHLCTVDGNIVPDPPVALHNCRHCNKVYPLTEYPEVSDPQQGSLAVSRQFYCSGECFLSRMAMVASARKAATGNMHRQQQRRGT